MNAIELLKSALEGSHRWYQGTVADITPEVANDVPPGRAHPIGSQMAHILHAEDGIVSMLQGQPPLWEREGWGDKLGLPMLFSQTQEGSRGFQCTPAQLAEYNKAVYAQTDAYVSGLTESDLDKPIDLTSWGIGEMPLAGVLTNLVLGNNFAHTGEISALKGTKGLQGYPF